MISKTFPGMDHRFIKIEISEEYIDFSFVGEINNQWFYDISKREWDKDYPRWQNHMRDKRWFTGEMESFIDEAISNTSTAVA